MQVTIYYHEDDQYILDQVDELAHRERKSRSAAILSILERYFEGEKRLGEILVDMGKLTQAQVDEILERQNQEEGTRRLGELLIAAKMVEPRLDSQFGPPMSSANTSVHVAPPSSDIRK